MEIFLWIPIRIWDFSLEIFGMPNAHLRKTPIFYLAEYKKKYIPNLRFDYQKFSKNPI